MAMFFAATYPGETLALILGDACPRQYDEADRPAGFSLNDVQLSLHIGARVAAAAAAGEVLVSSLVKDLVAGSGIRFTDRGVHALKGVPGDWRLYAAEYRPAS